jgi:uncharacterized protein YdcH (DUF465 family)
MFKKLLSIILAISFMFSQEPCEGTCLSEEETKNLFYNIQKCESDLEKAKEIEENLNSQIYMYIQTIENNSLIVEKYKQQLKLKDDIIKTIKPKWYENKYIWFGLGVAFTSGSVILAGQLK